MRVSTWLRFHHHASSEGSLCLSFPCRGAGQALGEQPVPQGFPQQAPNHGPAPTPVPGPGPGARKNPSSPPHATDWKHWGLLLTNEAVGRMRPMLTPHPWRASIAAAGGWHHPQLPGGAHHPSLARQVHPSLLQANKHPFPWHSRSPAPWGYPKI